MKEQSQSAVPFLVAVALLSLPILYVGGYFALVDRSGRLVMGEDSICRVRPYRYGGQVAEWLFYPARLVDEKLRPKK